MLGRREEEIEREEVERQLREVEMQERMAAEAEEQEREARVREMQERGEVVEVGERNLDDEVPEADQTQQTVEEGDEGDLDDEIPDGDEDEEEDGDDEEEDEDDEAADHGSGFGEGWTYDSRREPESDDEEGTAARLARLNGRPPSLPPPQSRGVGVNRAAVARAAAALGIHGDSEYRYDVDERQAAALADAMLDEDEMEGHDDEYGPARDDILGAEGEGRDLDDEVPDADEGGWEHTDTELEESEMDISVLSGQGMMPPGARRSSGVPFPSGNRRSTGGARVVSGNAVRFAQQQQQGITQTPIFDQTNALLGSSSVMVTNESSGMAGNEAAVHNYNNRTNWLNAAGTSARRNLFGNTRFGGGGGGLFTPSPRQEMETSPEAEEETGEGPGYRRRRSGRLLSGMGIGRRRENRDSVD